MSESEEAQNDEKEMEVDEESNDSSDDGNDEAELEEKAKNLETELQNNVYMYETHVELINIYRKLMDLSKMRATYERFSENFPLTPSLWLDWIKDEIRIASSDKEKQYVKTLFEKAVKDYLSVDLWLEYCQYSIGCNDLTETRKVFENAINHAGLHVSKGSLLWDAYREFEMAHLSCIADTESEEWLTQAKKVSEIFRRQLSVTLLDMDKTYVEWRVWCERLPSKNSDSIVNKDQVEWGYKKATKYMEDYKDLEMKLIHNLENKIDVFKEYIKWERHPEIIRGLYERAVESCCLNSEIWLEYCMYFFNYANYVSLLETCERALRNCPWSEDLWVFNIRALELNNKTHKEVTICLEKALQSGLQNGYQYLKLWLAYLEYYRRITDANNEESVEKLRSAFRKSLDHILSNFDPDDGDPECTILRLWAKVEANLLKNMQEARKIWNENGILKRNGTSATYWIELIELEKRFGDEKHLRKTYQRAITTAKDWPQCIVQSWLMYERECGTAESMINCMDACSHYMKKYEREMAENAKNIENENIEKNKMKKRKHELERPYYKTKQGKINKEPKQQETMEIEEAEEEQEKNKNGEETHNKNDTEMKDEKKFEKIDYEKENRSVFISNLDYSVTETELKEFLGELEELRLVTDRKGASKGYAYAVFETQEQAEKTLKRDREKLNARPVFLSRCKMDKMHREKQFLYSTRTEQHKLFVRGLPMTMNQDEVTEIFKPYGELKDVRLVTYRNGRSKGLAYIEYSSATEAANAILGTDNKEIRGFTISVAISAPPQRKTENFTAAVPEPPRHAKSRLQIPLVPRAVQVSNVAKPSTSTLSNEDFRKMLLNKK